MTDRGGGPNQNAEPTVNVSVPNSQETPRTVPSFVCVLPCTKPPVKYLDRLDGCASGIHVTREDTQDLPVLYDRMADVILDALSEVEASPRPLIRTPDPCAVCLDPIVPSPTSPILYMENCTHYYHYVCHLKWRDTRMTGRMDCPQCRVISSRALLWPQPFPSAAAKNEIIQLQKRCFGLYLAPETILMVSKSYLVDGFPAFDMAVWVERRGYKHLDVRKRRPPPRPQQARINQAEPQLASFPSELSMLSTRIGPMNEDVLVRVLQELYLADQPRAFFLGDILPLEENALYQAKYGPEPPMDDQTRRERLLFQFRCPFDRVVNGTPSGVRCSREYDCEFWHGWPVDTPAFIVERVKFRDFPSFFCMNSFRSGPKCVGRIRVHTHELVRCLDGFHFSAQDLKDIDGFGCKMAKQIMAPMDLPEQEHLVCAFCHKTDEPNSVWMHMQNCVHCLHVNCLSIVRRNNPNLKLDCPICHVPSMRTLVWPGAFPSDMVKQDIFGQQLDHFMLKDQNSDIPLEIVELGSGHSQGRPLAKLVNIFTVDYGGSEVVIINAATASNSTIYYD